MDTIAIEFEWRHTEQAYRDFIVNGKSLLETLMPQKVGSLVGMDTHLFSREKQYLAEQLLCVRSGEMNSGRVPIYICSCGDLECGALSVRVRIRDDQVEWSDFHFEYDYEEGDTFAVENARTLVFDLADYSSMFRGFLN